MSYGAPLIDPRRLKRTAGHERATRELEAELRMIVPATCEVTFWDEMDGVTRAGSRNGTLFSERPALLEAIRWLDATRDAKRDTTVDHGLHEWYVLLEWLDAGRPRNVPVALRARLVRTVENSIEFALAHQTPVDEEWCERILQSVDALDLAAAQDAKLRQACRGR
jgi:hypothetical protein